MGRGTWEWLKRNGIECESHKKEKVLFAYGSQEPLATMGKLTTVVESLANNVRGSADFVGIKREGGTLFCIDTTEKLNLLRIGATHVNSVGDTADDIRAKYPEPFDCVGLLRD